MSSQRHARRPEKTHMGGNLCWGQGMISFFPNERTEHKMTQQTIYIPRDCVTLSKSFVVYCMYLFLEAGCRQPACLSKIFSLSSRQPGFEGAPDFMLWRPKSSTFETNCQNHWYISLGQCPRTPFQPGGPIFAHC